MKKIMTVIATVLTMNCAHAGLLLEPYLGFNIASGEDGTSPATEYSQNAPFFGARLGYQTWGFMLGLDYTKGTKSNITIKNASGEGKIKGEQSTIGAFVGYNLPVLLRVWGGYYFDTTLETDTTELNGGGFGLGVGFTGLPFVSLNLEYRMMTFDEAKSGGSTFKLTGNSEIDYNQIMLSVSLPLNF